MRRLLKLISLSLAAIIIVISCKEDPTSTGTDLIPGEDNFRVDSVDSYTDSLTQTSRTYEEDVDLGAASRILLGRYNDIETDLLVRYSLGMTLPDSLEEAITNDSLFAVKAWVVMVPSYRLGDTLSTFDFSVHKITSEWSSSGFDKDSLAALTYDGADISSAKSFSDTLITYDINAEVPLLWMKKLVNDDLDKNNGLLFKPSAGVNQIIGFPAYSSIDYNLINIVVEKPGSFIDTVTFQPLIDVHVISNGTPAAGTSTTEFLQAGFSTRIRLQIDIPKDLPAGLIVNRAELELTVDPDQSINGDPSTDSIYVYIFEDETDTSYYDDRAGLLIRDGNKFKGTVTTLVQSWISGIENYGFRLHLGDELKSISKIAIKSSGAVDPADRPRLKFIYTYK